MNKKLDELLNYFSLAFTVIGQICLGDFYLFGQGAFADCHSIDAITVEGHMPPSTESDAFDGIPTDIPINVSCGTASLFLSATGWSQFTNYQESFTFMLNVISENEAFGTVTIIRQPACETEGIVEATANEGYVFKGWSMDDETQQYMKCLLPILDLVMLKFSTHSLSLGLKSLILV